MSPRPFVVSCPVDPCWPLFTDDKLSDVSDRFSDAQLAARLDNIDRLESLADSTIFLHDSRLRGSFSVSAFSFPDEPLTPFDAMVTNSSAGVDLDLRNDREKKLRRLEHVFVASTTMAASDRRRSPNNPGLLLLPPSSMFVGRRLRRDPPSPSITSGSESSVSTDDDIFERQSSDVELPPQFMLPPLSCSPPAIERRTFFERRRDRLRTSDDDEIERHRAAGDRSLTTRFFRSDLEPVSRDLPRSWIAPSPPTPSEFPDPFAFATIAIGTPEVDGRRPAAAAAAVADNGDTGGVDAGANGGNVVGVGGRRRSERLFSSDREDEDVRRRSSVET